MASRSRMPFPATTIAYDGNRIAVLALEETLPPTRIMTLRLKHYATRPAVQAFETYVHEAFSPDGIFAPGSITPPRIDPVKRREVLSARGGCSRRLRGRQPPAP